MHTKILSKFIVITALILLVYKIELIVRNDFKNKYHKMYRETNKMYRENYRKHFSDIIKFIHANALFLQKQNLAHHSKTIYRVYNNPIILIRLIP